MGKIRAMTQYTVTVKDQPGQLRRVCMALAREKISVLGISADTLGDVGVIRFIADRSLDVPKALEAVDCRVFPRPVFLVPLFNRVGELARMAKLLEDAGVGISALYGTAEDGEACRLVLAVDRPERAEKLLSAFAENLVLTAAR